MAASATELCPDNDFVSGTVKVQTGASLHYVRGGSGPVVLLIHGFPQDWREFRAIMPRLAQRYTVIAVDLRGIGESSATAGDYEAATMAADLHQLVLTLKLQRVYVVGHDVGATVAYVFARRYPTLTRGAMILDASIPGLGGWDESQADPSMWHVRFMQVRGLAERLVSGRHADFLGYFFSFGQFKQADIDGYLSAYATDEQIKAAFEMYRALPANAHFNEMQRGPSNVPLLLGAGEKSPFAPLLPKMADSLREMGFAHVETTLIPGAVHYLFEDQPETMAQLIEKHA